MRVFQESGKRVRLTLEAEDGPTLEIVDKPLGILVAALAKSLEATMRSGPLSIIGIMLLARHLAVGNGEFHKYLQQAVDGRSEIEILKEFFKEKEDGQKDVFADFIDDLKF